MRSYDGSYEEYNYGYAQGIWHVAYVKTSDPYYVVDWYIDDVFQESDYYDLAMGNEAYFSPYWLTGSVSGKDYVISVRVWEWNEDEEFRVYTDDYTLTVYAPIVLTQTKRELEENETKYFPDVSGYAELSRYYRVGNDVIMDYYIIANYMSDTDDEYTVWAECKNTISGIGTVLADDNGWKKIHKGDRTMSLPGSISNSLASGDDRDYTCEAYIRLVVQGSDGNEDNYHEPVFPFSTTFRPE